MIGEGKKIYSAADHKRAEPALLTVESYFSSLGYRCIESSFENEKQKKYDMVFVKETDEEDRLLAEVEMRFSWWDEVWNGKFAAKSPVSKKRYLHVPKRKDGKHFDYFATVAEDAEEIIVVKSEDIAEHLTLGDLIFRNTKKSKNEPFICCPHEKTQRYKKENGIWVSYGCIPNN